MRPYIVCLIALLATSWVHRAHADDACTDFKWDVSKERALFAGAANSIKAGTNDKTAPALVPGKLYQLQLVSQSQVKYVSEPGRKSHTESDHGGIAVLKIPASGAYRVSLDMPLWIDVVSNATLVPAADFQGQRDCKAPHKIVEFDLVTEATLTLQLSSSAADSVHVSVTAAPARKL
jgi:hypothetical protein